MSSITQSKTNISVNSHVNSTNVSSIWENAEESRYGIIPLLFIIIPCLAGIACAFALETHNMVLFVIAGAPAMTVEALILGMASMRSIIIASGISVVISIIAMFI